MAPEIPAIDLGAVVLQVINLDRSPERLLHAAGEIGRHWPGPWRRLAGIDGRRLDLARLRELGVVREASWLGRELWQGEVGCWLSHLRACRRLTASTEPATIIVEDDVTLSPGFLAILRDRLAALAGEGIGWDLIYLGCYEGITGYGPRFEGTPRLLGDFFRLTCDNRGCPGAYGYMVNRRGADRILAALSGRPIDMPIDEAVPRLADDGSLEILCASPALIHPSWHSRGILFPSEVVSGAPDPGRISRQQTDEVNQEFFGPST